jgi:hypothetical protein
MLFSVLDFREEYRQNVIEERFLYNSSISTDLSFNDLKENSHISSNFDLADNQFLPEENNSIIITRSELNSEPDGKSGQIKVNKRNVF